MFAPWMNEATELVCQYNKDSFKLTTSNVVTLRFVSSERKIYKQYSGSDLVLYFDTQGDITKQIKQAEEYLRNFQNNQKLVVDPKHPLRRNKYKNYLRVLDAVDSGATDTEIAEVLFSKNMVASAAILTTVGDQKEAAENMRSYVFLHLGAAGTDKFPTHIVFVHDG